MWRGRAGKIIKSAIDCKTWHHCLKAKRIKDLVKRESTEKANENTTIDMREKTEKAEKLSSQCKVWVLVDI